MDSNFEYGVNDKYDKFDKFDDVFYTQKLFKRVMNAFAHPLTEYGLDYVKNANGVNYAGRGAGMYIGAICRVFFDHTVSFYAYGEGGGAFAAEISETTYARLANLDEADYVVVMDAAGFDQWNKVYQGSLINPHAGATVIVAVPRIAGDINIEAEGPGIDGRAAFYIDGVIADCLNRAAALDIEYPKGFELLFVSRSGSLFAVPRHVKIYSGKIQ